MKNQNASGYIIQSSDKVFVGYGKSQPNISSSDSKPSVSMNNMPSNQNMLKVFDNNVNQMIHVQQPQLHTIQGRDIMIAGQRHSGPGLTSHNHGSYITINNVGTHNPVNGGSEYSSPRSSVGSAGDSKNSSPRSSMIHPSQQAPPPPYDARFRNSIASNLSSISIDSNRSSPRTSLAGGIMYDRFPSPRNSIVIPQDGNINISVTHNSLSNRNRFNEAAPPFHNIFVRPPVMNGNYGIVMNPVTAGSVNVHHIPVTQNGTVQAMVANTTNIRSQPNPTQISPPPAIPARMPKNQQGGSHQQQQHQQPESEIEALTKNLIISMSPASSPLPREPPPPYHGPHKTEPMPGLPPRNTTPNVSNRTPNSHLQMVGGNMLPKTPSSSVVSKLKYQITPPKSLGPSEAERKLNALTRQLEDEMESTEQGEYFGKLEKQMHGVSIIVFKKLSVLSQLQTSFH